MPPLRPRPPRRTSIVRDDCSKPASVVGQDALKPAAIFSEMPPPPNPLPPAGILELEMTALSGCLRNAVVKTGQVYGFYADSRRLGIQKYAFEPPRALTSSLGREVEKFDQLCDAVEAQLLRAITVLQRDLAREQRRLQDADKPSVVTRSRSKSKSQSPTSTRVPLPGSSTTNAGDLIFTEQAVNDPVSSSGNMSPPPISGGSASSGGPGRRGSAISLSSLHRPAFPHKLDLSSTTLRISAEEASLFSSGPLASPVTLAPRSARPSASTDIPPDFMAAFEVTTNANNRPVDIDLTVPDMGPSDTNPGSHGMNMTVPATLGNSADKPIELDLDMDMEMNMSDLFGDNGDASSTEAPDLPGLGGADTKQETMDMDLLDVLSTVGGADGDNDIFASFAQGGDSSSNQLHAQRVGSLPVPNTLSSGANAPSADSILASFTGSQMQTDHPSMSSSTDDLPGGDTSFDLNSIDLSNLSNVFGEEPGSVAAMEELLNAGGFGQSA